MNSTTRVLWVIPCVILLHNSEEALAFGAMWPQLQAALAQRTGVAIAQSADLMWVPLAFVTVAAFIVTGWAARRPDDSKRLWAALLVQAVMLVNVAAHVAAALFVMRGYSPGLLTAVAINLPFSLWIFRRAIRESWLTRRAFWMLWPAAVIVHGPLLFLLLMISGVAAIPTAPLPP